MKTTVKLNGRKSVLVEPASVGNEAWGDVLIRFTESDAGMFLAWLSIHECAALIFGLEMALEVRETRRMAAAL